MGNIWSPINRDCRCSQPGHWISTSTDAHSGTPFEQDALMEDYKRKRGGGFLKEPTISELKDAEDLIQYLSAHGTYAYLDDWVNISELTVVHITSLGSNVAVWLNREFTRIPTDIKLKALRNPSQAQLIFRQLEHAYAGHIEQELREKKLPMEEELWPSEKKWNSENRLRMVPSFGQVRNMMLSFLTISGPYCWPAGLVSKQEVGQYEIYTIKDKFGDVNLEDMTIRDPYAERVIRGLIPKKEYVDFFLSRLITYRDDQPHMLLEQLLKVDIRTLKDHNLLPDKGVLFILACRDCADVRSVDRVRKEAVLDDTVQSDANLGVNASLDEYCSQINCMNRTRFVEVSHSSSANDPNNHCKVSGCSKCMYRPDDLPDMGNKCLSCRETKAIQIYPNKDSPDCFMCFTADEILDLATEQLGVLNRDTRNIPPDRFLVNPIYKACRIDIRILKIILGWYTGNVNQKVFTRISNIEEAIELLNVLASFQHVIDPSSPIPESDQIFLEYMQNLLTGFLTDKKIWSKDASTELQEVRLVLERVLKGLERVLEDPSIYTKLMNGIIKKKESLEAIAGGAATASKY